MQPRAGSRNTRTPEIGTIQCLPVNIYYMYLGSPVPSVVRVLAFSRLFFSVLSSFFETTKEICKILMRISKELRFFVTFSHGILHAKFKVQK